MARRRLRIRGGGHIRISREWLDAQLEGSELTEGSVRQVPSPDEDPPIPDGGVSLGADVIERAEIITEGVFRPGVEDVEVKYVMSGRRPDRIDRLHPMASDRVISEATPVSVMTNVGQMIELVRRSGAADAGVIVDLHTHPSSGMAHPSNTDMNSWRSMAQALAREFPGARFLFGVHGVGRQAAAFLERTSPRGAGLNRLVWQSNTRGHEIALFTPDSLPIGVRFHG